jgi:hypothetical protein
VNLDDVFQDLLAIVSERGARVDVPLESERFFSRLVEGFRGTREELLAVARAEAPNWFRWVSGPPDWIHDAEWQFAENGEPMAFVGQLSIPAGLGVFHDEACLFVFIDLASGEVKTITQVS